jgi:uncharacterized protein (TIGR02285 family)
MDTVVWAPAHNPPFSIVEGDSAGEGVSQQIIALIAARTPDLVHVERPMPLARLIGMARNGHTLCSPVLLKTPDREAFLTFSDPYLNILPNLVFTRLGEARRWTGPDGEVDLAPALSRGLRVAVVRGRQYGPAIDAALAQSPGALEQVNSVESTIRMVGRGRVDATLMFGEQYAFLRKADPSLPRLEPVGVKGIGLNAARISCTKGPEGDRLVARMGQVIDAEFQQAAVGIYRAWLSPELIGFHQGRPGDSSEMSPR